MMFVHHQNAMILEEKLMINPPKCYDLGKIDDQAPNPWRITRTNPIWKVSITQQKNGGSRATSCPRSDMPWIARTDHQRFDGNILWWCIYIYIHIHMHISIHIYIYTYLYIYISYIYILYIPISYGDILQNIGKTYGDRNEATQLKIPIWNLRFAAGEEFWPTAIVGNCPQFWPPTAKDTLPFWIWELENQTKKWYITSAKVLKSSPNTNNFIAKRNMLIVYYSNTNTAGSVRISVDVDPYVSFSNYQ